MKESTCAGTSRPAAYARGGLGRRERKHMGKLVLTVIHRPEMMPEYLEKEASQGKKEDISGRGVIDASLDIFKTQQRLAHEAGLKTTIQMTYSSLFNAEAVELAREHQPRFR